MEKSTTNSAILCSGETAVLAKQIGTFGIPPGVRVVSHLVHLRGTIQVVLNTNI